MNNIDKTLYSLIERKSDYNPKKCDFISLFF